MIPGFSFLFISVTISPGGSILNMAVTQEITRLFSEVFTSEQRAPFRSRYTEGKITKAEAALSKKSIWLPAPWMTRSTVLTDDECQAILMWLLEQVKCYLPEGFDCLCRSQEARYVA